MDFIDACLNSVLELNITYFDIWPQNQNINSSWNALEWFEIHKRCIYVALRMSMINFALPPRRYDVLDFWVALQVYGANWYKFIKLWFFSEFFNEFWWAGKFFFNFHYILYKYLYRPVGKWKSGKNRQFFRIFPKYSQKMSPRYDVIPLWHHPSFKYLE